MNADLHNSELLTAKNKTDSESMLAKDVVLFSRCCQSVKAEFSERAKHLTTICEYEGNRKGLENMTFTGLCQPP